MSSLRKIWRAGNIAAVLLVMVSGAGAWASSSPSKQEFPSLLERVKTHEALRLLTLLGYDAGAVDRTMTINIKGAIRDFQVSHNLPVDGMVTDGLLVQLRSAKK
jgi:hypothetical protein